jgi:4-alpha-glucanotransferase
VWNRRGATQTVQLRFTTQLDIVLVTFTPSESYEHALKRAADHWGIELEYWDIWGKHHTATAEMISAVLRSMGVACSTQEEIDAALEDEYREQWSRPLPRTLVVDAARVQVPVRLPSSGHRGPVEMEIRFEDGRTERLSLDPVPVRTATVDGVEVHEVSVDLGEAPLGYHEISVEAPGAAPCRSRLIVCPAKAYFPGRLADNGRAAGIAFSLYGIRSDRNWGCGDFTDLGGIVEWVARDVGASFVALNPLHSIPNRQPYNTSPYLPNCSFYKNPIYLDVEQVPEFRRSRWASNLVSCSRIAGEIEALRNSEFVEYERVYRLKMVILKAAFREFLRDYRSGSARATKFRAYAEAEGKLLDDYAVYSALDEVQHKCNPAVWLCTDWPAEYHDPESQATREFARERSHLVLFYKWVQWQIEQQLSAAQQRAKELGMAIGLYHDLALATDRFGGDLWAYRRFYVEGCRVGAPPDDFSPNGQDWSFPPPNACQHYRDGYRLFAESIRKNLKHGGALRIDHVMRFFRLFWIPDELDAKRGVYVRDRSEDLLRILALESVRNQVIIIGEDLGTVGDDIREALERFGILSYRLFYFERWPDGRFKMPWEYPKQALVSSSTHDLPTLAGFWENRDIDARRSAGVLGDEQAFRAQIEQRAVEKQRILDTLHHAGLLPAGYGRNASEIPRLTGEIHNAIVGFLASTPAALMVLGEEDLMKQEDQQNLPGTTEQYPNWRHKTRFTAEEMLLNARARDYGEMYRGWLERTGRLNGEQTAEV